jgi:hypothetical protein|tara:strand:- start:145 stop:411 length:267 start_codon:yes stop_codon:yes gene_type:complete
MDLQKIATTGTAVTVLGTGAFVGGNHVVDQQTGGPQRRQSEQIEQIRQVVAEELYLQLKDAFPPKTGGVSGNKDRPPLNYRQQVLPPK